jgi:hypothetical protein
MAMKDTLGGIMKRPRAFLERGMQARWRAMSSRDELERGVARLMSISNQAQRHLVMRTVGDKWDSTQSASLFERADLFRKNWNPKRDFAFAMLHAERLTRILSDVLIAELLLEQRREDPAREELLVRWLERAEPRCRYLHDEIESRGQRLLDELAQAEAPASRAAE